MRENIAILPCALYGDVSSANEDRERVRIRREVDYVRRRSRLRHVLVDMRHVPESESVHLRYSSATYLESEKSNSPVGTKLHGGSLCAPGHHTAK